MQQNPTNTSFLTNFWGHWWWTHAAPLFWARPRRKIAVLGRTHVSTIIPSKHDQLDQLTNVLGKANHQRVFESLPFYFFVASHFEDFIQLAKMFLIDGRPWSQDYDYHDVMLLWYQEKDQNTKVHRPCSHKRSSSPMLALSLRALSNRAGTLEDSQGTRFEDSERWKAEAKQKLKPSLAEILILYSFWFLPTGASNHGIHFSNRILRRWIVQCLLCWLWRSAESFQSSNPLDHREFLGDQERPQHVSNEETTQSVEAERRSFFMGYSDVHRLNVFNGARLKGRHDVRHWGWGGNWPHLKHLVVYDGLKQSFVRQKKDLVGCLPVQVLVKIDYSTVHVQRIGTRKIPVGLAEAQTP